VNDDPDTVPIFVAADGVNPDVADRCTSYPVTPTLSVAPDHDNDTS
jgi:hypothetical protein